MEEVFLQVPCLDAVVSPALSARLHRDAGLWLFATGDPQKAERAFASAKRAQPDAGLPADLLPDAHPARALFDAAEVDPATTAPPPPAQGALVFDGAPGDRPTGGPTVAQHDTGGAPAFTRYLRADQPLPAYDAVVSGLTPETGPAPVAQAPAPVDREGKALAWTLTAGAGALAVGSGVLALVARGHQQTFQDDPPAGRTDLQDLYDRNRRASAASAVLLGGAGAVGAAAVFAW